MMRNLIIEFFTRENCNYADLLLFLKLFFEDIDDDIFNNSTQITVIHVDGSVAGVCLADRAGDILLTQVLEQYKNNSLEGYLLKATKEA